MKKTLLALTLLMFIAVTTNAQTTDPITANTMATFTVPSPEGLDSLAASHLPYADDLGVRRVIVADPDNDGVQEVISTDYSNGGRVHVMEYNADEGVLEVVWSSPVDTTSSGSTPRYPRVGDCDGDGNQEIIFERNGVVNPDGSVGRISLYEWNGTDWGTAPAFYITPTMLEAAGGREGLRFTREYLAVGDYDGDGRTEIIPHGAAPRQDVLILGVANSFPGFASIVIEGGKPDNSTNGGDFGAGNSYWNTIPADIDGDGTTELINHVWLYYGMWSIDVNGPDSYTYPVAADNAEAKSNGTYWEYLPTDACSYFGITAADVNGDGRDEIFGTAYTNGWDLTCHSFGTEDKGVYYWDSTSQTQNFGIIGPNTELAALAGRTAAGFWACVKGDVNQDGKDEIYTGGPQGLNIVSLQYKGEGSLIDKESYEANVVYAGDAGDVYAVYEIYNGKSTTTFDTTFVADTVSTIDTTYAFDPSIIDTTKSETPFTAYIYADDVDLDGDGKREIVISEQSVYDSITVKFYNWVDSLNTWEYDEPNSYKTFNEYRISVRLFEYDGTTGFSEQLLGVVTPDDYRLEQNYPNPFNPTTNISFTLPLDKKVSLKVYDMLGREVRSLVDAQDYKKGVHSMAWNGTNNAGQKVASGHYIARFTYGNFSKQIKMTLLK
ncbi:MAG: VCBS repeat-containing protein [Melioribacteraceae bacterium]|nr:VCBS repeat-containing protein [Melioribacteraceae bacterium]